LTSPHPFIEYTFIEIVFNKRANIPAKCPENKNFNKFSFQFVNIN